MKKALLILIILQPFCIVAQQDIMYTGVSSLPLFNPAYTSFKTKELSLYTNYQFPPKKFNDYSFSLAYAHRIDSSRHGFGVQANYSLMEFQNLTQIGLKYNYKIVSNKKNEWVIGIANNFQNLKIDLPLKNKITINDTLASMNLNSWTMDFSIGVLYKRKKFFAGISIVNLIRPVFTKVDKLRNYSSTLSRSVYFVLGYDFHINKRMILQPSLIIRELPSQRLFIAINEYFLNRYGSNSNFIDVNCDATIDKKILIGAGVRALQTDYISPFLKLGYSFDKFSIQFSAISPNDIFGFSSDLFLKVNF